MRLVYIANVRLPTERAHGINIVKMCEAFAACGIVVELIIPKRRNHISEDIYTYYGVRKNFVITPIDTLDFDMVRWGKIGFVLNQFAFSLRLFIRSYKGSIVFTRDELSGWLLRMRGVPVFYDMHGFPERKRFFWRIAMRAMTGIVATNKRKMKLTHTLFGVPQDKMLLAPNGYDPTLFASIVGIDKRALRKKKRLPIDHSIILYTGSLYDWKGVHVLAATAPLLPEHLFVFVGGPPYLSAEFKTRYRVVPNIVVLGQKPYTEIPEYLKSADVLVLPSSRKSKTERLAVFSEYDTSPIKLFEYMASGTPIIASDLPSTREIVNEKEALLVTPDNPKALATAIAKMLTDAALRTKLASGAQKKVAAHTWHNRAKSILSFIEQS